MPSARTVCDIGIHHRAAGGPFAGFGATSSLLLAPNRQLIGEIPAEPQVHWRSAVSDPLTDFIATCRVKIERAPSLPPWRRPMWVRSIDAATPRTAPAMPFTLTRPAIFPCSPWLGYPVHDHGSRGAVDIVEAVPEERALMSAHTDITANEGIVLRRVRLRDPSCTAYVPEYSHIFFIGTGANGIEHGKADDGP